MLHGAAPSLFLDHRRSGITEDSPSLRRRTLRTIVRQRQAFGRSSTCREESTLTTVCHFWHNIKKSLLTLPGLDYIRSMKLRVDLARKVEYAHISILFDLTKGEDNEKK